MRTHELQQNSRISNANVYVWVKCEVGWAGGEVSEREISSAWTVKKEIQFRAKLLLTQGLNFFLFFFFSPAQFLLLYSLSFPQSFNVSKFERMSQFSLLTLLYISIFHSLFVAFIYFTLSIHQFGLWKNYGKINHWSGMLSCCYQVTEQLCATLNQSSYVRRNLHVLPT